MMRITADYAVHRMELSPEQSARERGDRLVGERYGDRVKVYAIGDVDPAPRAERESPTFSKESCGGPHVEHTGELGAFKSSRSSPPVVVCDEYEPHSSRGS